MTTNEAAAIGARLDRLPASPYFWNLIALLSLGAFFELYDLGLTGAISPGLIRSGIFHAGSKGFFGLTDQATFAAVTFLALFIGTMVFAPIADRYGRRAIFTFSLLWYAAATILMALQNTAFKIDLWRFIASLGIGVELVTIDSYIAELVPKHIRGRAFGVNQCLQFTSVPAVALSSWLLVPIKPFGIEGWRWVALFPSIAAIFVWWIRRQVPESPRWLAQQGRIDEAKEIVAVMEARVTTELGRPLPDAVYTVQEEADRRGSLSEILQPPFLRRTIMLATMNFFQAIGFYGFNNWAPALMASQGASFVKSLQYTFIVGAIFPFSPLVFIFISDKIERKLQVIIGALSVAVFGLLFSFQFTALRLIILGGFLTVSNGLLSYGYHTYQSELYPTRVRARAIGFVYSFSRLSTVLSSFMIAFFLQKFGTFGVFAFIAVAMLMVILTVGIFGPRTSGLALEEISH
jgi:MFS transporter, putative metabolite:H+ symporter